MIDFTPTTFEPRFRTLVDQGAPDEELDEIDDALQHALRGSDNAKACAYATVEILAGANRPWTLAYALNTAIGASCMAGDTERARLYLERLINLATEHGTTQAALSAAENVGRLLPGNVNPDHVPHILHLVVRLYTYLGMVDKVIANQITAAHLFADFGAYPAAIRTLGEAQVLARDNKLIQPYLDAVSALHAICLQKEDHAYADHIWTTLKENCEQSGMPVPVQMTVNRATALFQTGDLEEARSGFEEALATMELGGEKRLSVLVNLSASLRELGQRALAELRMTEAREILSAIEKVDPEQPLELELIAAKNAVHRGDHDEAALCLNRAIKSLDAAVELVEKLHYRRGLRERYVPRIERLLASLPPLGIAADVIPVISATRANRVSDWLHFLDWTRALALKLSEAEKQELDRLIFRLANHGAPHLYGLREADDDPMSPRPVPEPEPWRELAEYADTACARHGVNRPFQKATSLVARDLMKQRLAEGYAILVNMLTAGHKMLLLIGDRYVLCDLPPSETAAFAEALVRHRYEPNQAQALAIAVNAYQTALLESLGPVLSELATEGCKGVIFIPDRMHLTPINLVMIADPKVRAKMAAGGFEVRTCLALYPAQRQVGTLATCLGIIEPGSNLRFDRADVERFFQGTGIDGTMLEGPTWDEFAARMASADSLVLSHHGMSVGLFTDPHFADMAGAGRHSAMSLAALQETAFRWPHRLIVLGTCHSGGLVNRNFQTKFRTHDLIGFPTVFLLNGRSEVLAASWAILDRFNLLFTTLFAPGLHDAPAATAACRALARLFEMPKEDLHDLLLRAFPADFEQTPAVLATMDNLRRQPFCYGAYQTYTLL